MMIRASQIIPVYPLTEDIRPGDLFLVEIPLQRQVSEYHTQGFLRLDQHLARLHGLDYAAFYAGDFGVGNAPASSPPRLWQAPLPDSTQAMMTWPAGPRAAFPTYTFEVKSGQGASLALPVQGVPIGLSLMHASAAVGSVTIADAYSYGVSLAQLLDSVTDWSRTPTIRTFLADERARAGHEIYVRAICRVYVTGQVLVSMSNTTSGSSGGSVAASKEVEMLDASDSSTQAYADALSKLNAGPIGTLPGGSVKIVQASSRSVSLSERFPRPLAIGYLSFDFPVDETGALDAPASTLSSLRDVRVVPLTGGMNVRSTLDEDYSRLEAVVEQEASPLRSRTYDLAAAALPKEFQDLYLAAKHSDHDQPFAVAKAKYLVGKSPVSHYRRLVYFALDRARMENH